MLLKLLLVLNVLCLCSARLYNEPVLRNVAGMVKSHGQPVHLMKQHKQAQDQGEATSCEATDPKFTLTWSPKEIKLGTTITIHFDMTPEVDLTQGSADLTVWMTDYPDPIYQVTKKFNCGVIHKIFPDICPFKKGVRLNVPGYKFYADPALPLPGGTFKLKVSITNESGQLLLCGMATLDIKHPDYDDYNY